MRISDCSSDVCSSDLISSSNVPLRRSRDMSSDVNRLRTIVMASPPTTIFVIHGFSPNAELPTRAATTEPIAALRPAIFFFILPLIPSGVRRLLRTLHHSHNPREDEIRQKEPDDNRVQIQAKRQDRKSVR